jgi:predicted transcriptional regulator
MTERVEVAHPDDEVLAVRARLNHRRVRQCPVVAAGKLVGIVTDRDLRATHEPTAKVAGMMTRDPVTTTPATPIEDAAALLKAAKIGALPVVEGGALVGIISESDLLAALIELTHVLEPTTLIEVECENGMPAAQRARGVLERHGAKVLWMRAAAEADGRFRAAFRVRAAMGHAPEQILEEAGFVVSACITGSAPPSRQT